MNQATLLQPAELEPASQVTGKLLEQLDRILLGRADVHRMVLVGILARGHILLEGLPGVGKTALVKALGELMHLQFGSVQFTPDLMPGDILGNHILQEDAQGQRQMVFQPGPVFTNLLLADEINRASPKTQSAMLEAMQERSVTLMGVTRKLPDPFFVLASQNPIELEGTYPLPEAQLDRFLFKLHVGDVNAEVLEKIIGTRRRGETPKAEWAMSDQDLHTLFAVMDRIFLPKPVARYIARLVSATHPGNAEATDQVTQYVSYGASPRAAIAMAEASRGYALLAGRPTVGFEDVRAIAAAVLNHRMILNYKARFDKVGTRDVIAGLLEQMDETGLNLPADMQISGAAQST
ncbi:MAG: AAA domain-containing protein [Planctomycetes bacterium]|nr:AAA domain-containing protein [Planctomycetota bacterium]